MSQPAILELKNLRKRYQQDLLKKPHLAVDDLTCAFGDGACTGLMGHNGAGKTTTIRMIFGLLRPDQGQILFRNQKITRHHRRLIGYMPEVNKLALNLKCSEILWNQLQLYQPPTLARRTYRQTIKTKLEEVGLWEHRGKRVSQLSKGMGRRLAWAQASIHQPQLLILDEPFSGLDPVGYQHMQGLIKAYRDAGNSIILCTHELHRATEICDQVYVIRKGKVVYQSQKSSDTNQHYNLELSGVSSEDFQKLRDSHKLPEAEKIHQDGYHFRIQLNHYQVAIQWLQSCMAQGFIVKGFTSAPGIDAKELIIHFEDRS